jgi:hypothetical protein
MNKNIQNFYDFSVNDFRLINYKYSDFDEKFEVAV